MRDSRLHTSLFAAALTAIFVCGCRSQTPAKGTFDDDIAKAKANGQDTVTIESPGGTPRFIESYQEEMKQGYAIHVRVESATSAALPVGHSIATWFKMSVISDLSQSPIPARSADQIPDKEIPADLLPLSQNEIVVRMMGGQVVLGGIRVRYGDFPPLFTAGKDYLIIVEPAGASHDLFVLPAGGEMAFAISADGDTLTALRPKRNTNIQDDIEAKFHNSLSLLKSSRNGGAL